MKKFYFYYSWNSAWGIYKNILYIPNLLGYFFKNLKRYFNFLWTDRDWDWAYLAAILETKLHYMAESTENYGCHTTSKRNAKRMRICVHLLRRLQEEDYLDRALKVIPNYGCAYKLSENIAKQDSEMLFGIMSKHLKEWWN